MDRHGPHKQCVAPRPWVRAYRAAHAIMVVKGDKQEGTQADKKEAKKL